MRPLLPIVLLAAAGAAAQPAPPLSFEVPLRLDTGPRPGCVLVADLNHDGRPDIVAGNGGGASVSVYLGGIRRTFEQAAGSPFPAGSAPNDIAAADFNNDGNIDIAAASRGGRSVTILLGDGTGGFKPAHGSPFSVPSEPYPHGIAAADLNGDGNIDIVVDSWTENRLLLLYGDGKGAFALPGEKIPVGPAPYEKPRVADVDNDSVPDLVTPDWHGSAVTVLHGDGHGHFAPVAERDIHVPPFPMGVAVGDFNADGRPDIAVCHFSGLPNDKGSDGLSILYGNAGGSFSLDPKSPYKTGHYPASITAGDIDGDGIADVVIPNAKDNTLTVYLGGRNGIRLMEGPPLPAGKGPAAAAIADLDGDRRPDLVVAEEGEGDIMILYGK